MWILLAYELGGKFGTYRSLWPFVETSKGANSSISNPAHRWIVDSGGRGRFVDY